MEKNQTQTQRPQEIEKAIRTVWDSLESHLMYTHSGKLPPHETREFHKKCIKEYAEVISILSQLY